MDSFRMTNAFDGTATAEEGAFFAFPLDSSIADRGLRFGPDGNSLLRPASQIRSLESGGARWL